MRAEHRVCIINPGGVNCQGRDQDLLSMEMSVNRGSSFTSSVCTPTGISVRCVCEGMYRRNERVKGP